jgi:hypothetical protein
MSEITQEQLDAAVAEAVTAATHMLTEAFVNASGAVLAHQFNFSDEMLQRWLGATKDTVSRMQSGPTAVDVAEGLANATVDVECPECHASFDVSTAIQERPFGKKRGVTEAGVQCPHCRHWKRSYYITPPLRHSFNAVEKALRRWQNNPMATNRRRLDHARAEHGRLFAETQSLFKE